MLGGAWGLGPGADRKQLNQVAKALNSGAEPTDVPSWKR